MTVAKLINYLKNFEEGKEILVDGYDIDEEDISHIVYEDSMDSVNIDTEMVKICHDAVPLVFGLPLNKLRNNPKEQNDKERQNYTLGEGR